MAAVETAIERGAFDYRAHFPRGSRPHVLYPNDRIRDAAVITFDDYIRRWHKNRSPILADGRIIQDPDIHPSTRIHDATVVRSRFVPAFRHLRLSEVTPYHCGAFRQSLLEEGLSGKTVGNIMGLLHKAFSDAIDEGLLEKTGASTQQSQRSTKPARTRFGKSAHGRRIPPLSEMDSWASGRRGKEDRSAAAGIYRGPGA
jgi:hypothetical protein